MTSAFGCPVFRYADWEYPVKEGNRVLYADQRFLKPKNLWFLNLKYHVMMHVF